MRSAFNLRGMRSITNLILLGALLVPGLAAQPRRQMREGSLHVGDPAPDFSLDTYDRTKRFTLSSFRGEQPVVLVFGSYT